MFFPTKKANAAASALQWTVIRDEYDSTTTASERDVAVATVHGRQDLVLIYSMLTDNHRQLVTVSRGVWVAVFFLFLILAKPS